MNEEEEEDEESILRQQEIKIPTNLLISEGNKYLRLLRFDKAISSFDLVLARDSNNAKAHLGRAKAYMRLSKYDDAWEGFQQVLNINPTCIEAIYLKGVAEYLREDFERSFFTFSEGSKIRPSSERLKMSHQLCTKSIENSLEIPMELTKEDTIKMANLLQLKDSTTKQKDDSFETYDKKGLFAKDLKLLEGFLNNRNLSSIHSLSKDVFNYMRGRQRFWKLQAPKISKRVFDPSTSKNDANCPQLRKSLNSQLKMCKSALKNGKLELCRNKGGELLKTLSNFSYENLPDKSKMETSVLHLLALSCLVEGNTSSALEFCEAQLAVARNNNMTDIKGRALRDMGEIYLMNDEHRKAHNCFLQSLEFAASRNEEAVLYYKISDCSVHLNDLDNAKNAACKCLNFATKSGDDRFRFDATLLLAEIAVKNKDMEAAGRFYRNALEIAIESQDDRQKDVRNLLKIVKETMGKKSYSDERVEMMKITDELKQQETIIENSIN